MGPCTLTLSLMSLHCDRLKSNGGQYSWWHDDVIKWKHFPRYWPFVREIHRSPVNSPHKGQWRRALMFSVICARINGWVNNLGAGEKRRHRTHCDVAIMGALANNHNHKSKVRLTLVKNGQSQYWLYLIGRLKVKMCVIGFQILNYAWVLSLFVFW